MRIPLLIASVIACLLLSTYGFTSEQRRLLIEDVEELQSKDPVHFVGSIVRLAFHEAATYSPPSTSGLDGCVWRDSRANTGLLDFMDMLDELRNKKYSTISRSDFWVFIASHSLDFASRHTGGYLGLVDNFRYGRRDLNSCESDGGKLVGPGSDVHQLFAVFQDRLLLTTQDIVAIMGGHSVGKADANHSGFEGPFDSTPSVFDNKYYKEMLLKEWERTKTPRDITFWENHAQNTMLFHTDVVLAYRAGAQNDTCNINMGPEQCSINTVFNTRHYVELFASDLNKFFSAFAIAWKKIMEIGVPEENLKYIGAC